MTVEEEGFLDFPPDFDKLASQLFPSEDPFDQPGKFDPVALLNTKFPDPNSLTSIDAYTADLKKQLAQTEDQIHKAVRGHSRAAAESRADLASAKGAISELSERIMAIRQRADETEKAVKHVSKDVMLLDVAKKNITATITTLKRLVMLVNACEQLTELAANRELGKTAGLVSAVRELHANFETLKGVPRVDELMKHSQRIFVDLRSQILEDFNSKLGDIFEQTVLRTGDESGEIPNRVEGQPKSVNSLKFDVAGAADTAEALGEAVKKEMIASYLQRIFADYRNQFSPSQNPGYPSSSIPGIPDPGSSLAGLEFVERRFQWLSKALRDHNDRFTSGNLSGNFSGNLSSNVSAGMSGSFPEHWFLASQICLQFCTITRQHLIELIRQPGNTNQPSIIMQALGKCVELETDMQRRFEKQFKEVTVRYSSKIPSIPEDRKSSFECPQFKGSMSECLEPFINPWIKQEERSLMEYIMNMRHVGVNGDDIIGAESALVKSNTNTLTNTSSLDQRSTNDAEDPRLVFQSTVEIFTRMKSLFSKCKGFSQGKDLQDLGFSLKKILCAYIDQVLRTRLPSAKQLGEENLEICSSVIGSCQYIKSTAPLLEGGFMRVLDEQFKSTITFKEEISRSEDISTDALSLAVACCLASEVSAGFHHMTTLDWHSVDFAAGVSPVISRMTSYMSRCFRELVSSLTFADFLRAAEVLAVRFVAQISDTLDSLRPIGEGGAQQLMMDLGALKHSLLEMPSSAGIKGQLGNFHVIINKGFSQQDSVLKALASSNSHDPIAVREMVKSLQPNLSEDDLTRLVDRVAFLQGSSGDAPNASTHTRDANIPQSSSLSFRGLSTAYGSAKSSIPSMSELSSIFGSKDSSVETAKTTAAKSFKSFSDSLKAGSKKFFASTKSSATLQPPPPPPPQQ